MSFGADTCQILVLRREILRIILVEAKLAVNSELSDVCSFGLKYDRLLAITLRTHLNKP